MANVQRNRFNALLDEKHDQAAPDPATISALLDSIPGAYDRAEDGIEDVKAGRVTELDEL